MGAFCAKPAPEAVPFAKAGGQPSRLRQLYTAWSERRADSVLRKHVKLAMDQAQANSVMHRCVKKEADPNGEYTSETGKSVNVQRFQVRSGKVRRSPFSP